MDEPLSNRNRETEFATALTATAVFVTNDSNSAVEFTFWTPDDDIYKTRIGPDLAAQMLASLRSCLEMIPQSSSHPTLGQMFGTTVPGKPHETAKAVTYFGQSYDPAILQALGVLMVRVNLLENNLVHLLAYVSGLSHDQAEAALQATNNMKARRDLIAALVPSSRHTLEKRAKVIDALERVKTVFNRRNALIHGQWSFKNDKFLVSSFQPIAARPRTERVETIKSLLEIAANYRDVAMEIASLAFSV